MWFVIRLFLFPLRWALKILAPLSLLLSAGLVGYLFFWLPDVSVLEDENPETTTFIELTRNRYQRAGVSERIRQSWVDLDDISPALVEGVLIAEDDRFFLHRGFDYTELANALEANLEANRFVRGGSTISQQLVKNLYLSPEKSYARKFNEALLTWKLEHTLSKERILELYLNVAEWGDGIFGVEEAALHYFKKKAANLNEREAVALAARLPNPHAKGDRPVQRRKARERIILERLQKTRPGYRGAKRTLLANHQPSKDGGNESWWDHESLNKIGGLAQKQFDVWWDEFTGDPEIVWKEPTNASPPPRRETIESVDRSLAPLPNRVRETRATVPIQPNSVNPSPSDRLLSGSAASRPPERQAVARRDKQAEILERIERLETPRLAPTPTQAPIIAPVVAPTETVPPKNPRAKDVYERLARLEKLLSKKD